MALFADVILPIAFDSFTYSVPSEWEGRIVRGCRVVVPLGKSKIYTGVVLRVHTDEPQGITIRQAMELLDDHPVVNEQQFRFWSWVAEYYLCPLGDVMKCALPGAMKPKDEEALREVSRKRKGSKSFLLGEDDPHYNSLNPAQQTAMQQIEAAWAGAADADGNTTKPTPTVLLHGVTSSGKTEIYIQLIRKYIEEGKQVLYLLPEIALTTQITERLRSVFGEDMGVYHSKFTDVQRLEVYKRQASSMPFKLILGVRSSIFLPFQNLGLVIVDEEHEQSYKQQEPAPRYHARSAALVLAQMFGANALLGTATPSFETYHHARKGHYGYVQLTQRYCDIQLPEVEVVDIKQLRHQKRMQGAFSPQLVEAINAALERKEQVILFQNRRGFSSFIECKQCSWVPRCPHCDVSLTYHKSQGILTCHYCGHTQRIPLKCPNCEEPSFVQIGTGTERIEDEIQALFPSAKTIRMDLDTAKTRAHYERIISSFARHEADILIGTQMVTKGLDFDNVSVVGILDADTLLNLPDFRAYERAFHTLTQVAGRAGRRQSGAKVLLQTRSADTPIISQIVSGSYWDMFYDQMLERQTFHYPPFTRLISVYMRHRDNDLLSHLADDMAKRLRQVFGSRVLGPDCPPVSRIQSLHIRKILIKMELTADVKRVRQALVAIQQQMTAQPVARNLNIYYDVDPM